MTCVEEVLLWVIVGRGGNHHKFGILIASLTIECSLEVKARGLQTFGLASADKGNVFILLRMEAGEIGFNIVVLDRRFPIIDQVDTLWDDIHGGDMVVLCQQSGNA